ncbi:sigma-70 family RNA polymerase sigma factor [Rossellomorea aquimaris]|uniref:sigma-70 family RNA polymerase sigma factor n=1 Tax=Rossellomorea aquimaris TaxID=189382 RepID=UPI001CD2C431|nr:sigma-70 family RNA polymerase sigma factor [Rossellomorea aquimaris]MCA1055224.1 sigma-70 family RNA polymerase sigma factor [Rossellomorea aquimaris]
MEESKVAIGELMDLYGKQLINLAYTYCKDWGMAEDIVQEVFLNAYRKLDTFEGESSYKTWLYTITINKSKDFLRKPVRRETFLQRVFFKVNQSQPTPEEVVVGKDDQSGLASEVMTLPIKYREIIILYYYEELSTAEAAELLRIPHSTAKTRLQRGRKLLRKQLEGCDYLAK